MGDFCNNICVEKDAFAGVLNGKLILLKWDGMKTTFNTCTALGLYQSDIYEGIIFGNGYSTAVLDEQMYFIALANYNQKLQRCFFKWNGSTRPEIIAAIDSNIYNGYIVNIVDGKVFFSSGKNHGLYDPKTNSIQSLAYKYIAPAITFKNKLYWVLSDSLVGAELFVSDTAGGEMTLVYDINEGPNSALPYNFLAYNDILYFTVSDSINNRCIYQYDGIKPPTRIMKYKDINYYISNIIPFNNKLYFIENIGTATQQLCFYDINSGEKKIALYPLQGYSLSYTLSLYRNKIFYSSTDNFTTGKRSMMAYNLDSNNMVTIPDPDDVNGFYYNEAWVFDDALYLQSPVNNGINIYRYYEEKPLAPEIKVYPNPATTALYIKAAIDSPQTFTITMHDAVGRIAMHQKIGSYPKGDHTIAASLRSLAAGIYIFTLRGNRGIILRQKIVKL